MPNKTAAQAWAEWAAAQLGDNPPEPAPESTQEQPEPAPANDNRPAPLPAPGMTHERKPGDVFADFINEYLR